MTKNQKKIPLKLSQRFRVWASQRGAPIIIIAIMVSLWIAQIWYQQRSQIPHITRTLGSTTQHVNILWLRQDISPYIATSDGMVYAISLTWNRLVAFDIKTGSNEWEVGLPFEQRGTESLFVNKNTIFTVNATSAYAYETATGELKWSTKLGDGHVSIVSQLDADELRIQYGDKLIELDPETGKILAGGQKPQNTGINIRLVGGKDKWICAGDLQTGKNHWCRTETYISKVAIDLQSQTGYAMRDDFVLVTIDLQTGNVLGETSFLPSGPAKEYFDFIPVVFSEGVVVISFSDSGQTFGLSFSQ